LDQLARQTLLYTQPLVVSTCFPDKMVMSSLSVPIHVNVDSCSIAVLIRKSSNSGMYGETVSEATLESAQYSGSMNMVSLSVSLLISLLLVFLTSSLFVNRSCRKKESREKKIIRRK
jgi:hypothetical protein